MTLPSLSLSLNKNRMQQGGTAQQHGINKITAIHQSRSSERTNEGIVMPDGVATSLTRDEFRDNKQRRNGSNRTNRLARWMQSRWVRWARRISFTDRSLQSVRTSNSPQWTCLCWSRSKSFHRGQSHRTAIRTSSAESWLACLAVATPEARAHKASNGRASKIRTR